MVNPSEDELTGDFSLFLKLLAALCGLACLEKLVYGFDACSYKLFSINRSDALDVDNLVSHFSMIFICVKKVSAQKPLPKYMQNLVFIQKNRKIVLAQNDLRKSMSFLSISLGSIRKTFWNRRIWLSLDRYTLSSCLPLRHHL